MPVARIVTNPHFSFISPEKIIKVAPSLAVWGAAAGSAVLLFGSDVPLVQKDLLSKIPFAGKYWAQPTADEE